MRVSYLGSSESSAFISTNSVRVPFYSEVTDSSYNEDDNKKSTSSLKATSPNATFFVRAQGDFTRAKHEPAEVSDIFLGDVLVVDRSLTARHGDTVIAREKGCMSVVTLQLNPDVILRPKNKAYSASGASVVEKGTPNVEVFGVVTSIVRPKS